MEKIVRLCTNRSDYDIRDSADCSMTIGELIDELKRYDEDTKVVFSNDGGYTYGTISDDDICSIIVETREEEAAREEREEYESTMEQIAEELTDLQARYENNVDDEPMTEEEYHEEMEDIFNSYGISKEDYRNYWVGQ